MSESKKLEDDFNQLGINLKDSPHVLEQLRMFNEFQKKFGIKIEKGANYTLKHPFERIRINPKKLPHRNYRKPFRLSRHTFTRNLKNKLQKKLRKGLL